MKKIIFIVTSALSIIFLSSCTKFEVVTQDGTIIKQTGAPLVSRKETFIVKHQWLDENNVLHEVSIERNFDENADAQERMLKAMEKMASQESSK
jgi:hypothetical protein